nr:hypothetical protein CFP56_74436 [Quercus suber]
MKRREAICNDWLSATTGCLSLDLRWENGGCSDDVTKRGMQPASRTIKLIESVLTSNVPKSSFLASFSDTLNMILDPLQDLTPGSPALISCKCSGIAVSNRSRHRSVPSWCTKLKSEQRQGTVGYGQLDTTTSVFLYGCICWVKCAKERILQSV